MQFVSYVLLLLAPTPLIMRLPAWWRVRRLYGYIPWSLIRQMISYGALSYGKHLLAWLGLALGVWALSEILYQAEILPEPHRILLLAIVVFIGCLVINMGLP